MTSILRTHSQYQLSHKWLFQETLISLQSRYKGLQIRHNPEELIEITLGILPHNLSVLQTPTRARERTVPPHHAREQ